MVRIADASAENLLPALRQSVEPGTLVQTDELGKNLLPKVNLTVSLLKRWLLGTHQGSIRPQHLDCYLDEFTFRFNRRTSKSRGLLFYRLLQQAVLLEPVRGKDLIGDRPLENAETTIDGI